MKSTIKFKTFTATLFAAFVLLSSCKKADEVVQAVSEEEAAEVIEYAVSSESGGMSEQVQTATDLISYCETLVGYCGMSYDSAISIVNPTGATIVYSYDFSWNWVLSCNNQYLPDKFAFSYELNGMYDSPGISSQGDGSSSLELSGLSAGNTYYSLKGSYIRNGTNQSKVGQKRSFTSKATIDVSNVLVDKTTGKFMSGTAEISFRAETSDGRTLTYDGTITFTGGDTATLKLENEYTIQL